MRYEFLIVRRWAGREVSHYYTSIQSCLDSIRHEGGLETDILSITRVDAGPNGPRAAEELREQRKSLAYAS